jgi:sugar phosphate permease
MSLGTATHRQKSDVETTTIRKVALVLIPFLMVCYFVSFIDRVNVGFAAFQMNKDLGLTASAFGLGGGLFVIRRGKRTPLEG